MKGFTKKLWFLVALAAFFLMLLPGRAFADDVVIYDAADFANLRGRTWQDVMEKYTEAQAYGKTYIDGSSESYYEVPASVTAPYAAGVLNPDTLEAMEGMSNFWRWLVGVDPITVNEESNASQQAQALDRNFHFDHKIDNSKKPADMDDALWAEGFELDHNIIASGYTPAGAVTGWLNEGYQPAKGTWDTVGHRTAILTAKFGGLTYGYSGQVAIGKVKNSGNTFANAFAAFPVAGYMPEELLKKEKSSWTVQLNEAVLDMTDPSKVEVTVENLSSGESYTCTTANEKLQITQNSYWDGLVLNFVQPTDAAGDSYEGSYKVTAAGLTDVATGKAAEITYTVDFFSLPRLGTLSLSETRFAYTGSEIRPEVTVKQGGRVLEAGTDYTVSYYNNVEAGTGIAEVSGTGSWCGTLRKTFAIEDDCGGDHLLEETNVVFADENSNVATVTSKCKICKREHHTTHYSAIGI